MTTDRETEHKEVEPGSRSSSPDRRGGRRRRRRRRRSRRSNSGSDPGESLLPLTSVWSSWNKTCDVNPPPPPGSAQGPQMAWRVKKRKGRSRGRSRKGKGGRGGGPTATPWPSTRACRGAWSADWGAPETGPAANHQTPTAQWVHTHTHTHTLTLLILCNNIDCICVYVCLVREVGGHGPSLGLGERQLQRWIWGRVGRLRRLQRRRRLAVCRRPGNTARTPTGPDWTGTGTRLDRYGDQNTLFWSNRHL